jgi:hypothetical protein
MRLAVLVLLAACAPQETHHPPVAGPPIRTPIEPNVQVVGQETRCSASAVTVDCTVTQRAKCIERVEVRSSVESTIERTGERLGVWFGLGGAWAALAGGLVVVGQIAGDAEEVMNISAAGVGALAFGGLLTGALSGVRALDSVEKLPDQVSIEEGETRDCSGGPAADTPLLMIMHDGSSQHAMTDAQGKAMFNVPPANRGGVITGKAWATVQTPDGTRTDVRPGSLRLAKALKLLVLDIRPMPDTKPSAATMLTSILLSQLDSVGGVTTTSRADIEAMLDVERQKDAIGCNDVRCAAELGGALGADAVLSGEVGQLGSRYNVSLTVIDSQKSVVLARASALMPANDDELLDAVPGLVADLIHKLSAR